MLRNGLRDFEFWGAFFPDTAASSSVLLSFFFFRDPRLFGDLDLFDLPFFFFEPCLLFGLPFDFPSIVLNHNSLSSFCLFIHFWW